MNSQYQGMLSLSRLFQEYSRPGGASLRVSALSRMVSAVYPWVNYQLYSISENFVITRDDAFRSPNPIHSIGGREYSDGLAEFSRLDAKARPILRSCALTVEPFETSDPEYISRFICEHVEVSEIEGCIEDSASPNGTLFVIPVGNGVVSKSAIVLHSPESLPAEDKAFWRLVAATLHWLFGEELSRPREKWRYRLFEESSAPALVLDGLGTISRANRAFLRLWGAESADKLIGHSVAALCRIAHVESPNLEDIRCSERWHGRISARDKENRRFYLEAAAYTDRTDNDSILSIVVTLLPTWTPGVDEYSHFRNENAAVLSEREENIAEMIGDGWRTKEIADVLNVSVNTVQFHRHRIRRKLGLIGSGESIRDEVRRALKWPQSFSR